MSDAYPIRCRCGRLQGSIAHPARGARGVCYCRDCQAYAKFLGPPPGMLDAHGGTEIVAVRAPQVTLSQGLDELACMSLSPRGTLRWYARCCGTPIANTPRDPRVPHVGVVHSALGSAPSLEAAFGPVKLRVNRHGAKGRAPKAPPVTTLRALARFVASMAWTRASGGWRRTPFFDAAGWPRVEPQVLDANARAAAYAHT